MSVGRLALGLPGKLLLTTGAGPEMAQVTKWPTPPNGTRQAAQQGHPLCHGHPVIIAIYTVIDAKGARAWGNALQYVVSLFLRDGWPLREPLVGFGP